LVIVGNINETKLKEMTKKTEKLINRKIRTLVLNNSEFLDLVKNLDIKHSLYIWGKPYSG